MTFNINQPNELLALFPFFQSGVAPLFWAPASDRSGRRFILILSQICNIGGCFVCTFSPNVYVFLVGRIIMAAGSGAGLSVGAGVVADVYKREERGRAFGIFYLGCVAKLTAAVPSGFCSWIHHRRSTTCTLRGNLGRLLDRSLHL